MLITYTIGYMSLHVDCIASSRCPGPRRCGRFCRRPSRMPFPSSSWLPAAARLPTSRGTYGLCSRSFHRRLSFQPLHNTPHNPLLTRPPLLSPHSRWFCSTSALFQEPSSPDVASSREPGTASKPKRSLLSRLVSSGENPSKSASSFRAIVSLAKPEKKPLTMAVGLLLVSSSVSMSIPFTIGKLIDYFTSSNPVSAARLFMQ